MNEAQQAEVVKLARYRMAAFDHLPQPIRRALEATKTIPDVMMVTELWDRARMGQGEEQATAWMLQSIEAWNQQCGGLGPVAKLRRRHRQISHKLAPPVPEYAHGA